MQSIHSMFLPMTNKLFSKIECNYLTRRGHWLQTMTKYYKNIWHSRKCHQNGTPYWSPKHAIICLCPNRNLVTMRKRKLIFPPLGGTYHAEFLPFRITTLTIWNNFTYLSRKNVSNLAKIQEFPRRKDFTQRIVNFSSLDKSFDVSFLGPLFFVSFGW